MPNEPLRIRELRVTPLAIPMRFAFEHAAATRQVADPVVVQLIAAAPYAEHSGFGETLARLYVTGESITTVLRDIETLAAALERFAPTSFTEAIAWLDELPFVIEGRVITAARTALELALIDLAGHAFGRQATDLAGWLDLPGFGAPGALREVRVSGFALGKSARSAKRLMTLQRCAGLRDFKLKVATEGWEQRLRWTAEALGAPLRRGACTLRVDANGAWGLSEAHEALELLERHHVSILEQPLSEANDPDLDWLAEQSSVAISVDESLILEQDAERLIASGGVQVYNIRLAKHGGLIPSLRIARQVIAAGRDVQLGCLVGESSILSAAEHAFLSICPRVRCIETTYQRWLLKQDVARRGPDIGLGGRLRPRKGFGLGVDVSAERVNALAAEPTRVTRF